MSSREQQREKLASIMKYAGFAMAVVYMFLGFFMLSYGKYSLRIPPGQVKVFGVLLVAYGVYRGIRLYFKHFRNQDHENDRAPL